MGRVSGSCQLLHRPFRQSFHAADTPQMYLYSQQLGQRGQDYMQKHNVAYSKDGGVKVGVKQTSDEEYSSKIQRNLVNTWNQSSFPDDYKSRFWNKEEANKAKSK